jgi:hypothetical protein
MRSMRTAGLFRYFVFAAICLAACALAHADGQTVHRCIGAQGEIVFSGLPCGTPAPTVGQASSSSPFGRTTSAVNCPASVETLRALIAEALARRDANAIAGVMRWDGVGGAAARQRMREIAELAARPMLGIDTMGGELPVDVPAGSTAQEGDEAPRPMPETTSATTLTVRTGSSEDGGSREHEFGVVHSDGCYWLDW